MKKEERLGRRGEGFPGRRFSVCKDLEAGSSLGGLEGM